MTRAVGLGSRVWSGVILIVLGLLLLLDRMWVLDFGEFVSRWWPSALILMGVCHLLSAQTRRWGGPLLLIAVGVILQVDRLKIFSWWRAANLWPALLIGVGLWLLLHRARPLAGGMPAESGELVDAFVVWGGMERAVASKQFRGGEATAVMGGIELDLRQAQLAPGEQRLKLNAVMGGIEVRVPENWQVVVEGMPLMGAIEDARKATSAASPAEAATSASRLLVEAFALMGGIEVKT